MKNNAKGMPEEIGFDVWGSRLPLDRKNLLRQIEAKTLLTQNLQALLPKAQHPQAALAGILLFGGCWSESHELVQNLSDIEGSYWHAILHRMEPDFFNSQYWFRQVNGHSIFEELHRSAADILAQSGPSQWRLNETWSPLQLNRWIEATETSLPQFRELATSLHTLEARLLLAWCCQSR